MEQLLRFSQASTALHAALTLEVDADIDKSQVCIDPSGKHILVNGEPFAMIILATGVVTVPTCTPLYRSVEEIFVRSSARRPLMACLEWTAGYAGSRLRTSSSLAPTPCSSLGRAVET